MRTPPPTCCWAALELVQRFLDLEATQHEILQCTQQSGLQTPHKSGLFRNVGFTQTHTNTHRGTYTHIVYCIIIVHILYLHYFFTL